MSIPVRAGVPTSPDALPATMLAAVVRAHGGPEQVRVEEVPRPEVTAADDVIVRVRACALNRLDVFARRGLTGPGLRERRLPFVSGVDIAGEIAEVGSGATGWRLGERVVVYPGIGCGRCRECLAGEPSMCRRFEIIGETRDGGLAQYCRVPAANLERLADHVAFETAAALPAAYTTAWRMLVTVGRTVPSDTVLVMGASGGVGTAAVAIARLLGARVFALSSGADKARRLRALGAEQVFDRAADALDEAVAAHTGGRGVDVVVNPVAGPSWRQAIRALAPGGRMLLCGATAGDAPEISVREVYQSHRQLLGAPLGNRTDFRAVLDLVERGALAPTIDTVLPLRDIAEAHARLEGGRVFGKLVVEVP